MHPTSMFHLDSIGHYSPVTLNDEWPQLGRLMFVLVCSCFGSTMNGFFVAAFFVEHSLKRAGNVFLACIGMADLMVTSVVMSVSAVILLSGQWDTIPVCHVLHFFVLSSTYCYSLFFVLVAMETYYRLCRSSEEYDVFISMRIGLVSVLLYTVSFIMAGVGVYLEFDYDYCERKHFGDFYFRVATIVIFHAIPSLITMFCLISSSFGIRRRARDQLYYKRSQQYGRDSSSTYLNIAAYIFYVVAWIPYLVIVLEYPDTTDNRFYHSVWIGVSRSVLTSFLYSIMNRSFRRAFAHLFNYCCCKSTLTSSFASRHRRAMDYKSTTGDVRVHIMHQAVNSSSPQRALSSYRETQEL